MSFKGRAYIHSLQVFLILVFGLCFSIATAQAKTNHALIVGVSEYPNLEKRFWLSGPKNDAALIRDYLTANELLSFDGDNIITLADGLENAAEPTLGAIRDAFAQLTKTVKPGDFVYLHFSGHGSQAPALKPGEEQDGLDELFLPADIGPWQDSIGTVENALVDDEIGELIGRLRAKGASVWAVFDSCHSGTVTRGVGKANPDDEEVSRKLPLDALRIPHTAMENIETTQMRGEKSGNESSALIDSSKAGEGIFVAFYAAQTNQTTPEMNLPPTDPDRRPHGLFTYTLFEALSQNPDLSYRQLGQEILRRYSINYRVQPTPLFEGDLDATVFGSHNKGHIQQWPLVDTLSGYSISAGRIHGLTKDEELIVVPSPAARNEESVARLKVSKLTDLSAILVSAESGFLTLDSNLYVRKMSSSINFGLSVSTPDIAAENQKMAEMAETIVSALGNSDLPGLRLTLVEPSQNADIRLIIEDGHLWLAPPSGEVIFSGIEKTPSILLGGRPAEEVAQLAADSLARISRATNLMKLGSTYASGAFDADLKVKTRSARNPTFSYLETASVSAVHPGDEMHIEVTNSSPSAIDINILYVGSDYSIGFVHNARVHSAETLNKLLGRFEDKSFGRERLIMVTTAAKPQSAVEDLSWLAQAGLENTRSNSDTAPSAFSQVLNTAGFGRVTRSFRAVSDGDEGSTGAISQIEFRVQPLP